MTDEDTLRRLAERYVWWQTADQTIARRDHFLCQLMQLATAEDMSVAFRLVGKDAFRAALLNAPAGILDARSWNFWHRMLLGSAPPPLPTRPLPA